VPGVIHVAPAMSSDLNSDWVHVEYVASQPPVAVLLDAKDGAGCLDPDWTLAVVGTAYLGKNLIADSEPEECSEFAAFSKGREIVFRTEPGMMSWTDDAADVHTEDPLPVPDSRFVSVVVGVFPSMGQPSTWTRDEILRASALYDKNRAGIQFDEVALFTHSHDSALPMEEACETGFINDVLEDPFDITVSADLFVLFVPSIDGILGSAHGYACPAGSDHKGRVIYLASQSYLVSTLAHEIGHQLSLRDPYIDFKGGHTNLVGSFRRDNLMWDPPYGDVQVRSNRDRFSVGQVYRMNLHRQSWLNIMLGTDPLVLPDCWVHNTTGVCPATDKEPGG
jgi:hypothetical protein